MKNISSDFKAYLDGATELLRADLFTIDMSLKNPGFSDRGGILYTTNGQQDVVFDGHTYWASLYGLWDRGAQTSAADFSLESKSMELTALLDLDATFPGNWPSGAFHGLPLINFVSSGIFDGAAVTVTTVYMSPSWGQIVGSMGLFGGTIVSAQQAGRSKVTFEVRDWNYLLNLKVPMRTIQAGCYHNLGDHGCGASVPDSLNMAGAGSTQSLIKPYDPWDSSFWINHPNTPAIHASDRGYFVGGKLHWTDNNPGRGFGQNVGLWGTIVADDADGNLYLAAPMPFPVNERDEFYAFPGCDKTTARCKLLFDNLKHFGGFPFVPPPEQGV